MITELLLGGELVGSKMTGSSPIASSPFLVNSFLTDHVLICLIAFQSSHSITLYRHEEVTVRSTAYNDRLVSSTPVLTAGERHKRQQLQRREAELQHELAQLKERYELLQVRICRFTLLN